jgi:hypothetical protein
VTAGKKHPEWDGQNGAARTGQAKRYRQNRTYVKNGLAEETCRMEQSEPGTQNVIGSKGQAGRDEQNGTEGRGRETRALRHIQA